MDERRVTTDRRVVQIDVAADRRVRRRRGRPRISDLGSERIDLRIPLPNYDALCVVALAEGLDVRAMARQILIAGISAVKNRRMPPHP